MHEAEGWVTKHSPYKGPMLWVHKGIAEIVNDLHEQQFWMSMVEFSRKLRLSRTTTKACVHRLVADGCLEIVEPAASEAWKPTFYRFLWPDVPVVWQPRGVATRPGVVSARPGVVSPQPGVVSARPQIRSRSEEDPKKEGGAPAEKRGWRRVPSSEQLTPDRRRMAWELKNLPSDVAAQEWAAFMDHTFPHARVDVDATWRNWCRKSKYRLPAPPPAPGKRTAGDDHAKRDLTRLGSILKDVGL